MYLAILLSIDLIMFIHTFMFLWRAPVRKPAAIIPVFALVAAHAYFLMNHLQP